MEPHDADPGRPDSPGATEPPDPAEGHNEAGASSAHGTRDVEQISEPAKLVRVIGMTRQLLDEMHHDGLDLPARERAHRNYREALHQIRGLLPPTDREELNQLLDPLENDAASAEVEEVPSGTALRLAEAQLLGWLDGLLKGLEAQEAARQAQSEADQATQAKRTQRRHEPRRPRPEEQGHGYR